jgi:hypothetical protein
MRSMQKQLGTWEPSQYLLEDKENLRDPVSRWPVAGTFRCVLTTSHQSGKQKNVVAR